MSRCPVCGASRVVGVDGVFPPHPMFSVFGPLRWRWCPEGAMPDVIGAVES